MILENMNGILNQVYFGNTLRNYLIAFGIFVAAVMVLFAFRAFILSRLKGWAARTVNKIDDFIVRLVERSLIPLLYLGAIYLAFQSLNFNPLINRIINILTLSIITLVTVRFGVAFIDQALRFFWLKGEDDEVKRKSLQGIINIIKVFVWGLAIILLLDNLGFKISAVIAGLGIGGVAVALAAQAVLGDLFSYFAIFFDRPFELGDFIIVGDLLGTVEHIGVKTTRVRSLGGEQLVFSNSDLTSSRIKNYKRMQKRRVVFKVGVIYQTPIDKLREIPGIIKNVISNTPDTVFDRAHFFSYGDFALIYEIVYYVLSGDYNKYMDLQQQINFGIHQEFQKRDIQFAYPTQTVYVNKQ
jgi:small-conductance mechanosensitive channel